MSRETIQRYKECYFCGNDLNLHRHHIYAGRNRKTAEADNMCVWLCHDHHTGDHGIHGIHGEEMNRELHQVGQLSFLASGRTQEEFMARYGRNYLESEVDSGTAKKILLVETADRFL